MSFNIPLVSLENGKCSLLNKEWLSYHLEISIFAFKKKPVHLIDMAEISGVSEKKNDKTSFLV